MQRLLLRAFQRFSAIRGPNLTVSDVLYEPSKASAGTSATSFGAICSLTTTGCSASGVGPPLPVSRGATVLDGRKVAAQVGLVFMQNEMR